MIAGKGNDEICWKVIVSSDLDKLGSRQKENGNLKNGFEILRSDLAECIINFWPGNLWEQHNELNNKIEERMNKPRRIIHERTMKLVTKPELLTFIGLVIGAANESVRGRNLWQKDKRLPD